MGDTAIEWTDKTWNPLTGCEFVSTECRGCYAAREAHGRLSHHPAYAGLTEVREGELPRFTGEIREQRDRLDQPLRWRAPARIFVNSMSDLFHRDVSEDFIAEVFAVMARAERHTFQILTKRPARMAALTNSESFRQIVGIKAGLGPGIIWPLWNVWLGTSIGLDRYTYRADDLRATAAAVRFLSCEPLLEALPSLDCSRIDQVIVGSESGPRARIMELAWAREIREKTEAAGAAFFVKQISRIGQPNKPVKAIEEFPVDLRIREYPS